MTTVSAGGYAARPRPCGVQNGERGRPGGGRAHPPARAGRRTHHGEPAGRHRGGDLMTDEARVRPPGARCRPRRPARPPTSRTTGCPAVGPPGRSQAAEPAGLPGRARGARGDRRRLLLRRDLGLDKVGDQFSSAADYDGPGTARCRSRCTLVTPRPRSDATSRPPGWSRRSTPSSTRRTPTPTPRASRAGYFPLKKEMAADDVVTILVDPSNLVKDTVTIPRASGSRDTVSDPRGQDEVLEEGLREGA